MDTLRQLSGKLAKEYQLAGISFRLSEPLRAREESALISAAAKNFRQKAADIASAFGYRTYEIKEITVGQPNVHKPVYPTTAMASREIGEPSSIPPAAGHTEVIVNVSGIAVMK
jgi:predicted secreted protein